MTPASPACCISTLMNQSPLDRTPAHSVQGVIRGPFRVPRLGAGVTVHRETVNSPGSRWGKLPAGLGFIIWCLVLLTVFGVRQWNAAWAADSAATEPQICRPELEVAPTLELGQSGVFRWTCPGTGRSDTGYFIVFVRPQGTYVLLKVPDDSSSFEFTPDAVGVWRWIVINTDPDRTRPDVESEQGRFVVTEPAPEK
jgi:hypothetical protein